MIVERTHVSLAFYAHAVVASVIDSETGELTRRRLSTVRRSWWRGSSVAAYTRNSVT